MTDQFTAPIDRDLVVVHGPDATSFLQSLVSQDLDPVEVGESVHTLLLQPQGKLIVDFYALRHDTDEWWCVVEGGFGSQLADGLRRFKIRVKVEIEQRETSALALRGVEPPAGSTYVRVAWDQERAYDVLDSDGEPTADAGAYERARIEAGVPRMGADLDEKVIPQEAGLERDAVSFTKGCFLGQELVCRIDTRGHVNRTLRRLRGIELPVGAEVTLDGKTVGAITSSAGDVALGFVRREVEPGATVTVGDEHAVVEAV